MVQKTWTKEIAAAKVQAWYDQLKTAIDSANWEAVGKLYNANSLLYASDKGKAYIGPKAIERFWKSHHLRNGLYTAQIQALYPIDPPERRGRRLVRQGALWTGILKAETEVKLLFCGGGGHIDPCSFANPDFEIYPF